LRLEGSLDAFSLPDIFALLAMTKKTGALELRRPGVSGVVYFSGGSITGASSDLSRQALGRRLVAAGLVGDRTLAEAVDRVAADPAVGLGRVLHQEEAVDEAVLHEAVTEQVIDAVFDLLRWPDGDFSFAVDAANPDDVGIAQGVDEVVADSRRRLDAWQAVAAAVPSPTTVLSLAVSLAGEATIDRDGWTVLALVDGRRTVAQVCDLAGRGEYAVVSTMAELVRRGLLRVDDADGVPALVRRQRLLSRLEGAAEATAEPAAPEQAEVTPARPEPFLPRRTPDHPEEVSARVGSAIAARMSMARTGTVEGTSAVAPLAPVAEPSGLIDRDPSVNKSLLLRLIAGVRGL
jgi:hypothetical protein